MNYKNTLNLPKNNFPMKANLPQKEPQIQSDWEKKDLYNLIRQKYKNRPKYILHDGPPYANGNIHIGHALNKTLKDIVVKYKTMQGFDVPYVPGWDCHGMPIEHQLFKQLGVEKHQVDKIKFRYKARDFALKFVKIQKQEFKRLGIFGEWENPYLTMNNKYETAIVSSFKKLVSKGYVYKGLKPINWCVYCETALAEAEVEYDEHISPSIYTAFELLSSPDKITSKPIKGKVYIIIWTTTPWTLIDNVAVAVNPNLEYALVNIVDKNFIVACNLVDQVMENAKIKDYKIIATAKGKQFEDLTAQHPFIKDRQSKIVSADYVSSEDGTGCVHIAPGHGQDDYEVGLKHSLPIEMVVDEKGCFIEHDIVKGIDIFKGNEIIIEHLRKLGSLLYRGGINHSYPHCWRCKKPIIVRATEQWFIGVDINGLREKTKQAIKQVKWIPSAGEKRIAGMVTNRPDWCLSRQRYWGVPIPAIYCRKCRRGILDVRIIDAFEKSVAEKGSTTWFSKDLKEFLPKGFKCEKCEGTDFIKENDIMDVWFDSGVSHQAVIEARANLQFPADLYLEGSDQHRGWFQSSMLTSIGITGKSPFDTVLTHGFVVDKDGKKMSKSIGNVIAPQDIIKKFGADILRLWAASSDYNDDIKISDEIIARSIDVYRKLRNSFKFLIGNLYDFDLEKDYVSYDKMVDIDKWVLLRLKNLLSQVNQAYDEFAFYKVYHNIYNFCTVDLSSFYLDIMKDILYTFKADSLQRRSCQTALYEILMVLTKITAPIIPFTAEEVWRYIKEMNKNKDYEQSVHLSLWPEDKDEWLDNGFTKEWEEIIKVREAVLKALEEKRSAGIIGNSLEAKLNICIGDRETFEAVSKYEEMLPAILLVSQAEVQKDNKCEGIVVMVDNADGFKCNRCWNYSDTVGKDSKHPEICAKCIEAIS